MENVPMDILRFRFVYKTQTFLKIINYLLMSIFFFVVGLEIKRELTSGHIATLKKAMLPFGAFGCVQATRLDHERSTSLW